jgi:REP element-mobilizing transposase RayT
LVKGMVAMAWRRIGGEASGGGGKQLCLVFPNGWGGRRQGAGRRSRSNRGNVRHQARPKHRAGEPVHVTLRSEFRPLRSAFVFPTVRGAIRDLNRRWRDRFRVVHFSVQSDHLHLIVEAADRKALLGGVRGLSVSLARRVNQLVFRRGRVMADRWHGRALSTPRAVRHVLAYLLGNFRKHEQLAVGAIDPFSSAPYFLGFLEFAKGVPAAANLQRVAGVELARGSPVLEPRSWLLRTGWQRHGLISIHEAPRGHSDPLPQSPRM